MSVNGVTNTNSSTVTTAASSSKNSVGKDEFLKLMMTQMQYQDPLNPMDNSQMLSQLAQFSSLEQISNLNSNIERTGSASMVGHTVQGTTADGEIVIGVVSHIEFEDGYPVIIVDEQRIPMTNLIKIA